MPDCILVIPCFNEARRLNVRAFVEQAVRADCDLLFVNDGSTDATGDVLDDLCAVNPAHLSALHLPENGGKAEAVRRGMQRAFERNPQYVGYWDADLATPLEAASEFRGYLAAHPHVEILLGARVRLLGRSIERRASRHCAGRVFATAASWVLNVPVYDTQCGAKLFRNTARTRVLFAEPFRTRWIFDVELLARFLVAAHVAGESPLDLIHELPLRVWQDVAGSKVRAGDFVRAAVQLAEIACRYRMLRTASHVAGPRVPPAATSAPVEDASLASRVPPGAGPAEVGASQPEQVA